jgi:hypothetical protein
VDDDDLGPVLIRLLTDGRFRATWSEAARSGAAAFSWSVVVKAHEEAYLRATGALGSP